MNELLTLEELRAELVHDNGGKLDRSFAAAIRERNELRAQASASAMEADGWFGRVEMVEGKLSEAETELAALRDRIDEAPVVTATPNGVVRTYTYGEFPAKAEVRLVVENKE